GTWYMRGEPADYDAWRDAGLTGWGWDDMAAAYQQIENYRAPGAHATRGADGPLQITPSDYDSDVFRAIAAAGQGMGVPWLDDICTPGVQGIGRTQYTVDRRGKRASAYEAFVAPIRHRRNLTILTNHLVERIRLADGRAVGIATHSAAGQRDYTARAEVIICAGVYKSPQLLQLSGIGPGALLTSHGVSVAHESPAVGRGFCDHHKLGISYDLHNHPGTNRQYVGWRLYRNAMRYFLTGRGPLARVGLPLTMMWSSEGRADWPDFQMAAAPFAMRTVAEMVAKPGSPITDRPGITFSGYNLRPHSRGSVAIASADIREQPLVDCNWWGDPRDEDKAVALLGKLREFAAAPALAQFVGNERVPGTGVQDGAALIAQVRQMVEAGLHGTGTCAMGVDAATSVTDARCRVHGVGALRVVDCSIMPTPVSGNTNGPAMAVGARAAEFILADARA
ncbi:MAG: GMC family oxidoreductase, partial [Sphingopyxis sp.]